MWIIFIVLAILYLSGRRKAADTPSPDPGPNSDPDPDLAPALVQTVEEEAERVIALLMKAWRDNPNGGYR